MNTNPPQNPPIDNGFVRLLQEHREGLSLHELSEKLRELTEAVHLVGKGGTVTLKIRVAPASRGSGNAYTVTAEIDTNLPQRDPEASFFFADDQHNLLRHNPRQRELPLRTVPTPEPAEPQQPQPAANEASA